MSIVPNAAMNSANIFATAALLDTSATNGRALPPARSISVTTFCADSGLMSLTPIVAPSRANVRPISRPSPEPPPVISTTLSLSFIDILLFAFLELPFPIEPPRFGARRLCFRHHSFLLIEHAEVGVRQDVFRLLRNIFFRQLDRSVVQIFLVGHVGLHRMRTRFAHTHPPYILDSALWRIRPHRPKQTFTKFCANATTPRFPSTSSTSD